MLRNIDGQSPKVGVVKTGAANWASVYAALLRIGAEPYDVEDAKGVADAAWLLVPGVAAFGAAMDGLHARGLEQALVARIEARKPTLLICVGMQLLCEGSDETPNIAGLGILKHRVRPLCPGVRVPHLGWNTIEVDAQGADATALSAGYAYFANSYALQEAPQGFTTAWCTHGKPFVAAVQDGGVLGCQFHPELSGAFGHALMKRWIAGETMKPKEP